MKSILLGGNMKNLNFFTKLSEANPESVAIEHNGIQYTYQDIHSKVDLLAMGLRKNGVNNGSLIGVYMDRSVYTIISILSIWKAGGVYVPLNKLLPEKHNRNIIDSSKIEFILVNEEAPTQWRNGSVSIIDINAERNKEYKNERISPMNQISGKSVGKQPAYIIHTSGTTGKPKGIMVSHENVSNYLAWCDEYFQPEELSRCLFSGAVSFDISLMEMIATLYHHGTLVVVESVLDVINSKKLLPTAMFVTPSGFGELLVQNRVPSSLQTLILGGEVLPKNMVEKILDRDIRLINAYGPSETTILATSHLVTRDSLNGKSVPVGKPIPNTDIRILNKNNEICQNEEIGEIVIYGKNVSLGYLETENTKKSFGFDKETGQPFYMSGDLGFYNNKGLIEIYGRKDTQVKLRGFRIDLTGLEAVMENQSVVQKCCFLVEQNGSRDVLHAFIQTKNNILIDKEEILKTYKDEMPGYCIPNQLHIVESFPLNHNGKLDTDYLLSKVQLMSRDEKLDEKLDENNLKDFIVLFLRKQLNNSSVNADDNFYQVGCNSLLGMRLSIEIQKKFGCIIPLVDLFSLKTPKKVATEYHNNRWDKTIKKIDVEIKNEKKQRCSSAQKRLLYMNQKLNSNDSHFNEYYVFEIKGSIIAEKLEEALHLVIERHSPLNTKYSIINGEFWQSKIEDDVRINVEEISDPKMLDTRIMSEINKGFDLLNERSIRCTLFKQQGKFTCVITIHHIAFDGISEGIFFSELNEVYRSLLLNESPSFEPVSNSYYSYCTDEESWLKTPEYESSLAYWKETLNKAPHVHSIPLDHRREKTPKYCGSRHITKLSTESISRLKWVCQENNTTLFSGFYAILCLAIEKYSFEKEICIGTPVANRNTAEYSNLIGFFVNTVPLFVDLNQAETFQEVLEKCSNVILGSLKHQRTPLTDIIGVLDIDRDTSYSPLLQTLFVYEEEQDELLNITGCTIEKKDYYNNRTQFDLTFLVRQKNDVFELVIEYDNNLFEESSIVALSSLYTLMLNYFSLSPKALAFDAPLLNAAKLPELTTSKQDRLPFPSVTAWFEEITKRQPNAIALSKDNLDLTYIELNERANKLSCYLSNIGVKPGMIVCVLFGRSVDAIVSILAVMKAGAAYLPIENNVPKKRLEYIIDSTKLGFIITDTHLETVDGKFKTINLNDRSIEEKINQCTSENPSKVHQTDLAYVLFTSGTTGLPKGARISHQALLSHVQSAHNQYNMNSSTVTLQYSSLNFDVATSDIICSLTCGGRLHLIDKDTLYSSKRISDEIEREGITHINIAPPSLSTIEIRKSYSLQTINIGGEVCPEDLLQKWKGICEFYISYGPTECAVCSSSISVQNRKEKNSIGKPIGENIYLVCDSYGNIVPNGVPGYLYIAGPQVMSGYVNSNNNGIFHLTFGENSIKVYNSNDIVRKMPSGEYQFLGRQDDLVKINGHRISLSEISNAAGKKDYIRNATVMLHNLVNSSSAIVLFVQMEPNALEEKELINILKSDLAEELPMYMIPSRIISISEVPITDNGKTDFKKLRSIINNGEHIEPMPKESFTEVESGVLDLWIELLGEGIHKEIDRSFFSVGGNSLLYIKLLNNIRKKYGVDFTLEEISRIQTVREIAQEIERLITKKKTVPTDFKIEENAYVEEW
ncbi:hypothetical protein CN536_14395 [Bacillus cereus]|nr:hypothetical protein CN536_14395 [Bacillus cereus]